MIEIKNVNFKYKGDTNGGLKDFSLSVPDGETLLLCGSSGCGKTTVTRLINGLIPHYYKGELEGTVLVNGKDIKNTELYDLASVVGTVFQNPRSQFFSTDTDGEITFSAENIGMDRNLILKRKNEVVEELNIKKLLGRSIFELSGGEKQIIASASIEVLSPDIIVLDEPSSNLDIEAIEELKRIIKIWKDKGKTIIIAEHRLYFLKDLVDRLILLEDGVIKKDLSKDMIDKLSYEDTLNMHLRPLSLKNLKFEKSDLIESSDEIELKDFKYMYRDKKHGIDISSIKIPRYGITAIIGHNGAGKSTFVRNICGLLGKKGKMILDGEALSYKKRLKNCYMIMQDVNHQLFTSSAYDEVDLSIREKLSLDNKKELILDILSKLDLELYKDSHPMSLSGGEKQRLAIASGISSNKPIIIFDEPTSGLDLSSMMKVKDEIIKLRNMKKTIFVVTHDLEFILSCSDYILHLEDGKVVENYNLNQNTYPDLMKFFLNSIS